MDQEENKNSSLNRDIENASWYVLKVYAGKEQAVAIRLKEKLEGMHAAGDSVQILETQVPLKKYKTIKNGKEKIVNKVVWPGYIFIRTFLDEEARSWVKSVRGVFDFVGGIDSSPVPNEEIVALNAPDKDDNAECMVSKFKEGDSVSISTGPLHNTPATFVEMLPKGKARVKISIFGRSNLVDLDWDQIESE